jgi:hypothetical protein
MNFTTDLPKKDPIVSYIVASAVKCEKFFPESANQGPVFRMHAVILTSKGSKRLDNSGQCKKDNEIGGSDLAKINFGVSSQTLKRDSLSKTAVSSRRLEETKTSPKWTPSKNLGSYILCHVRRVT